MGMFDEMKEDAMADVMSTMLETEKGKEYMEMAKKFVKPALSHLLKELGPDDTRLMLYYDNESKRLVFMKFKTANVKAMDIDLDPHKDIYTIDPAEIKKGNIEGVIKDVMSKIGGKLM